MTVDLGCGGNKRGDVGIDMVQLPGVDKVCHLGFERIPLEDGVADKVLAYDLLEHIPGTVYVPATYRGTFLDRMEVRHPRIFLLGEVHRILRTGGKFESFTPSHTSPNWCKDPTHDGPPWCRESWDYFTGKIPKWMAEAYGIGFAFKMVSVEYVDKYGGHLKVVVEK